MEEDARTGVRALPRVDEPAARVALEAHAVGDEFVDGLARVADHAAHGAGIVLVMSRAHGVLEIALLVPLVVQDADAALRQKGVALPRAALADEQHALRSGQMQGAVHARDARADDERIGIDGIHCASSSILCRARLAPSATAGATSTGVPSPAKARRSASVVIFFMSPQTKSGRRR